MHFCNRIRYSSPLIEDTIDTPFEIDNEEFLSFVSYVSMIIEVDIEAMVLYHRLNQLLTTYDWLTSKCLFVID